MFDKRDLLLLFILFFTMKLVRLEGTEDMTLCFLLEDDSYYTTYGRVGPAVDLGVSHANEFILPANIHFNYVFQSLGPSCAGIQHAALVNVLHLIDGNRKCDVFLGIGCPTAVSAIYGVAETYVTPILGCPSAGVTSLALNSNMSSYFYSLRIPFGFKRLSHFVQLFLEMNSYEHVTVLRDDTFSIFSLFSKFLMTHLQTENPTIFKHTTERPFFSLTARATDYQELLQMSSDLSRVVFVFAHADAVREIMITAHQMGLTDGNYVYITIELYELAYWGTIESIKNDGRDEMAEEAFQNLLVISLRDTETNSLEDTFADLIKNLARSKFNYTYKPLEKIDPVVVGHYEAVMIYAQEISRMSKNALNIHNGTLLIERISGNEYNGISNKISIGSDGERDVDFDMKIYKPYRLRFETVLQTIAFCSTNKSVRWLKKRFWSTLDGFLPPDEPTCGFRNDKCNEERLSKKFVGLTIILPILVSVSLSAAGVFLYLRYKYQKLQDNYDPDWWHIPVEELVIKNRIGNRNSMKVLQTPSTSEATTMHTEYSSYLCEILASYKGTLIALSDVSCFQLIPQADTISKLNLIKNNPHTNLQRLIGLGIGNSGVSEFIVNELCCRGSLSDIFDNEMIKLDWSFRNSLIKDLILGMAHLHSTPIISHGNLSSYCCLIDSRFTLKIADYGMPFFRNATCLQPPSVSDPPGRQYTLLLWRAPELLREVAPALGTQKGDVYSFAIILQQIILRGPPFHLSNDPFELSPKEVLDEIMMPTIPPARPRVPRPVCSNELYDLMERCWEENPLQRPTFQKIKEQMKKYVGDTGDIVDVLFKRMEQYATDLELKVAKRTQEFMDEKTRSEQFLAQLLPKTVVAALTRGENVYPEAFEGATIFFSDIVGFTGICSVTKPMDIIALLNALFTFIDDILSKYDVYKVETIGDAYLVCSGLPVRNGNRHVAEIASMALTVVRELPGFPIPKTPPEVIQVRIGISSGPCVAGIVGVKMPRYCLFGDTVNVASRMESTGEPMKIQISESTKLLLDNIGGFLTTIRGPVPVKGKGLLTTYWLIG